MSKKRKLMLFVTILTSIVIVSVATFHAMNYDGSDNYESNNFEAFIFDKSEIGCCSNDYFHSVCGVVRLYAAEHIFGYDEDLDEIFNAGNAFVDVVSFSRPGNMVVEFWTEQQQDTAMRSMRMLCSPGRHVGSFINVRESWQIFHRGMGGLGFCMDVLRWSANCSNCLALIQETWTVPIDCRQC